MEKFKARSYNVFKKNDYNKNILKSIEELQELSLILTQHLNKPNKNLDDKIEEEIAHVKFRLLFLEKTFNRLSIKKEMRKKLKQIENNVNNR